MEAPKTHLPAPTLLKHRAVVLSSGALSLQARHAYNHMLYAAHQNGTITSDEYNTMPVRDLCDRIGLDRRQYVHLKNLLESIRTAAVNYDINKEGYGRAFGAVSLISEWHVENGTVSWDYPKSIRKLLARPEVYVKLSLLLLGKVKTKAGHIVAELVSSFLGVHSTGWWDVDTLAELFGVNYSWKLLNARCVKPGVEEAQEALDVQIKTETRKSGRKVTHVRFLIQPRQADLFSQPADEEDTPDPLYDLLDSLDEGVRQQIRARAEKMVPDNVTPLTREGLVFGAMRKILREEYQPAPNA